MKSVYCGLFIVFLFFTILTTYAEYEYSVQVRVIVQDEILQQGYQDDIQSWIEHAADYFLSEVEIPIQFSSIQEFSIPNEDRGRWHHHLQAAIMQKYAGLYKEPQESLLMFVTAENDAGKTSSGYGVSVVGMNPDERDGKQLSRKWCVVHELSHLFETHDLRDANNIMDEDVFMNVTEETESSLRFDADSLAIMKLGYSYMAKKGISAFSFIRTDTETGEAVIPHMVALRDKMRKPEVIDSSCGAFYINNQQYQKALDHLNRALEIMNENPKDGFQNTAIDLVMYNKGIGLFCLNRFEEAIETFQESIELEPRSTSNKQYWLAISYRQLNPDLNPWTDETINTVTSLLQQSVEYHPGDAYAWYELSVMQLRAIPVNEWDSDAVEEVKKSLQTCIDLKPDFSWAVSMLAAVYQFQDNHEEAAPLIQRAKILGGATHFVIYKKGGAIMAKI